MAVVKPFKGILPSRDKVHLVTSRSFDSYDHHTLNDKLKYNPFSFLHIIKPDFNAEKKIKSNSPDYLQNVRAKYEEFLKKEYFESDEKDSFYVYRQESYGNVYTGIIGCASIDDYVDGVIKVHEQTLGQREEKLKDYLRVVNINAEPVCLTYTPDYRLEEIMNVTVEQEPFFDFSTTDNTRHKLWKISDDTTVAEISKRFEGMEAVYIADGHHRSASSALLGQVMRNENPTAQSDAGFNYFMSIYIPSDQLKIHEYNRLVKDLNGLSVIEFLKRVEEKFEVEERGKKAVIPDEEHIFGMYLKNKWYKLTVDKSAMDNSTAIGSLDAKILSQYLLSPILNITDLSSRKSARISFVGGVGIDVVKRVQKSVDDGDMKVAFTLFPATVEQLIKVADNKEIMPPKSTWVEPKMRSALVIYSLSDS